MIGIENDLSLNTLIVSGVIAVVGWALKKTLSFLCGLLVDSIKSLIKKLTETMTRMEMLSAKVDVLTVAVGDHEKLRKDIEIYFTELKKLRTQIEQIQNNH